MLFKSLLFLLPSLSLLAAPGYHLPWGKDADLRIASPQTHTSKDSTAVFLAKKVILFHQKVLSPIDGPRSHFYPCSSQYMKLAMTEHGFYKGLIMGCDRLLRENKSAWIYRNIQIKGQLIKYDPPRRKPLTGDSS